MEKAFAVVPISNQFQSLDISVEWVYGGVL